MTRVAFEYDLNTEEGREQLQALTRALFGAESASEKFGRATEEAERKVEEASDSYRESIQKIDEVLATAAVAGIAMATAAVISATAKMWEHTAAMRANSKEHKQYEKALTEAERTLNRLIAASGAYEALLSPITTLIKDQEKALRDDSVQAQNLALDIADGLVTALEVLIQAGGFAIDTLYAADAGFTVVSNSVSIFFELLMLVGNAVTHFTNEVMMGLLSVLERFGENTEVLARAIGADGLANSIGEARQAARSLERQIQEFDNANLEQAAQSMERIGEHTEDSANALVEYKKSSDGVQAAMTKIQSLTDKMRDNLARARASVRPLGKRFSQIGRDTKQIEETLEKTADGPMSALMAMADAMRSSTEQVVGVLGEIDDQYWDSYIEQLETVEERMRGAFSGYDTPFGEIAEGLGDISTEVLGVTKHYYELRKAGIGASDALQMSAAAGLNAIGEAAASQIKDTRKAAGVRGAFAAAESALMFAQSNVPGGVAAAAAAAMHFTVAATSGSSVGRGANSKSSTPTVSSSQRQDVEQQQRRQAKYIAEAIDGDSPGGGGIVIQNDFSRAMLLGDTPDVSDALTDAMLEGLERRGVTIGGA